MNIKIACLGGGSLYFPRVLADLALANEVAGSEVVLYDIDAEKAERDAAKEAKAVEKLIKQINEINAEADTALLNSTALKALLKEEKKTIRDAAKAVKKAEKLAAKAEVKVRAADVTSILDQIIAEASSEDSETESSEEMDVEPPVTLKSQLEDQIAALNIEDSDSDGEESIASLVIDSD